MQRQLILLVLFTLSTCALLADSNPLFQHIQQLKQTKSSVAFNPFYATKDISQSSDLQEIVKAATLLEVEQTQLNLIKKRHAALIELTIPIHAQSAITIDLFAKDIYKKDAIYKNSIGQKLNIEPAQFYRGVVQNDPHSIAAISFVGDEIMGVISSPMLGNLVIGKLRNGDDRHVIYRDSDLYEQNTTACHADILPYISDTQLLPVAEQKSATCGKVIDIYFEADHIFYQAAGNSQQTVFNYLGGLFNVVATLFQREDISIRISEVKVWTTPDPYPTDSAEDALIRFRETLNGQFNGDAAQLLSLYTGGNPSSPNGGLAFIDKLCTDKALSVSYSNIDGIYRPLPFFSWDVFLITHEFGHTFGSPHTHACRWGASGTESLDNCFETEGGCARGAAPVDGGTMMSYCHVTTDGVNLSNGFGTAPGNLIRNRVAAANCLAIGNENFTATIETFGGTTIAEGDTLDLIADPNSNTHIYQWYRNNQRLDGGVGSIYRASEAGEYTVEISKNGCTEISNSLTVSVQNLQVNMSCSPSNCMNCAGRDITIDAGVNADTYRWSTGATTRSINVTTAGSYSVTVTSGSNNATGSTTVQFTTESRTDNVEICEGESYTVGNSTYRNSGTFTDFITNENGCMEEVTTNLTVHPTLEENNAVSICAGESITVGNSVYTQSGNYTDILMTENGCERRINTQLTVLPTYRNEQDITICEGGSFTVGNDTYTTAGTYEYTFSSINNCDSVIVTYLMISENYTIEQNVNLCTGESITVGNSVYTQTGNYQDELMASDGCDSIVFTNLTVFSPYNIENNVTICAGEQIMVGNSVYTETGTYQDMLMSSQGCDSIIMTQLLVLANSETTQNISLCEGESVTVGNSTYSTTGTYIDVLTNTNNCDSTVTTNLTFSDQIVVEENINLCYGAEYEGQIFTENATFNSEGISVNGCDSLHILNIRVSDELTIDFITDHISCSENRGAITATVSGGSGDYIYTWSNGANTNTLAEIPAGDYELLVMDNNGCTTTATATVRNESDVQITNEITPISCTNKRDAAIDLTITSGMPPFTTFWSNGPLTEDIEGIGAGNYSVTITDANNCQFDTTFVIENPELLVATISFSGTNDMGTATVNVFGGASPYTYTWSNGETTQTITNVTAGTYEVVVTDANGCTTTANITVGTAANVSEVADIQQFNLYPNPNRGVFDIQVELAKRQVVEVLIYNAIGQEVQREWLNPQRSIRQQIELNQPILGVYWLVLKTETWQVSERFLVR